MRVCMLFVLTISTLLQCTGTTELSRNMVFQYPEARRDDSVVDDYHGTKIHDPYRWLEDPDANETKEFVEAQNRVTRTYLETCPDKNDIKERLTELWNYPKYSCPFRKGNRYFFFKNTGLQNQDVLYVQDSLDDKPRVFLDPNTLSEYGTVALIENQFTDDGSSFGYELSANGSDWTTIHFKDVATGKNYPEVLKRVKFSTISWTKDNKGLFYSMYPEQKGKTDGSATDMSRDQKLMYHRLNTPQSEDVVVVELPEEPMWFIFSKVSDCGKYLLVTTVRDNHHNLLFFAKLDDYAQIDGKLKLTPVVQEFEANYEYITNEGSVCIFHTNNNATNYRIIMIDLNNPARDKWTTLVPEHSSDVLDWAVAVDNDKMILHYIRDVKSVLQLHDLKTGEYIQTFPLDVGSVIGFKGNKNQTEIFYQFMSFLTPGIIYRVDFKNKPYTPTKFREVSVRGFDPSQYEANQIFYSSKDGTKIPMFIISKKNLPRNGSNPALMYGYGGFNYALQPSFLVERLVFMQHLNGIVAIPNVRGGGEYGKRWHNAGRLLNKQNSFDDFHAAAEYLVKEKYTSPALLTIEGESNGGLLVAACINQRPELYGAAIIHVGVLDMLRFHKLTVGYIGVSEYGSSDNKEQFEYLLKYSPLHNIQPPGQNRSQYPATLVMSADHDDRVVPLHSLKFIATLQHATAALPAQRAPLLARIETNAGHGFGKPTAKIIEEHTDILCFITQALGLRSTNP